MRVITTAAAMQRLALKAKAAGQKIGFVPTMGYLHAGHVSLVHHARRLVGAKGLVVVSIYVNPTQFAPHEDLAKYPRDLARDKKLCREAGVDFIFLPTNTEMYPPPGPSGFSTYVVEETLSRSMEGASRPTHFRGVTTVVAKLFNLVLPDVSVFGAKDWQQAAVIQRMHRDLNFPGKIIVAPTVREADGLALSSRNKYLSPAQRTQGLVLSRSLRMAGEAVKKTRQVPAAKLKKVIGELIATQPEARLDYVEFFHPETLQPVTTVEKGTHVALAVFVGKTRLIDNARL